MRIVGSGFLTFCLLAFLLTNISAQSNLNMALQDSLNFHIGVNDVNGWVAEDGREYALVGLNNGVAIVNVDSTPLQQVAFVPQVDNLWRDINTFGHYAYVTSEARVGLLIIDLQYLPDSVQTYVWQDSLPTANGKRIFEKAHTLFIDEFGIAYLNGSNVNGGGVVMIDVASNPTDPVFLGYGPAIYSHDVYARDSILYSAEIYAGTLSIYDVHDPQNVTLLGQVKTPNEFTHNAWLSDDSRYLYTTDERANSYVAAYDILDPANIIEVDRFRQAAVDGSGAIPHNVYVWNDWLVVAYYTSGTLIVDGSRPGNLVEVGNFDSFLGADGGFSGVWGSYPFLPSGKILSSDRQTGLYVFVPNYVRAAFLEGMVVDSVTGNPLQGATVTIVSIEIVKPQSTLLDGTFKTGKAIPGTFDIVVSKAGYYTKIIQGQFVNGEVLTPIIQLSALPTYEFSGKVVDSNGEIVPFAQVILTGDAGIFETITGPDGVFLLPAVYGGQYEVQAGIWGAILETDILIGAPQNITLQLVDGYKDDFDLDLGWIVSGQVSEGQWVRGIPSEQILYDNWQCGSPSDSPYDTGDFLYSTGLSATINAANDEVSGGTTILSTPPMDLSTLLEPRLSFDYWLCEFPPNQFVGFQVWMVNGVDTTLLTELTNDTIAGSWQIYSVDLLLNDPDENVSIIFTARDTVTNQPDYILKVQVDNFRITESGTSVEDETAQTNHLILYPNPVNGNHIYLKADNDLKGNLLTISLFDLHGREMTSYQIETLNSQVDIMHHLDDGIYFMRWHTNKGESGIEKVLVKKK